MMNATKTEMAHCLTATASGARADFIITYTVAYSRAYLGYAQNPLGLHTFPRHQLAKAWPTGNGVMDFGLYSAANFGFLSNHAVNI